MTKRKSYKEAMKKFSEQRKREMLLMRSKYTLAQIGKEYGLSRQRVSQIIGKTGRMQRVAQ